jgi:gamma-glutamyl-gamma-aminobutyrate hydrolase PuuD
VEHQLIDGLDITHDTNIEQQAPYTPVHLVKILRNTMLNDIAKNHYNFYKPLGGALPEDIYFANSIHHQAINDLREGFVVSAISADGTIEAMEASQAEGAPYEGQYVAGFQWPRVCR